MKVLAAATLAFAAGFAAPIAINSAHAQATRTAPKPRVTPGSNEIRAGNRVIGIDPDPFIRGEILRHRNSGWPD
jgi:hypothetical protein